jgi:MOSC domain-containing protein YiiM
MKILSIQVGRPKPLTRGGKTLTTAIIKKPVKGAVRVERLGLAGDGQADHRYHGGLDKAVYGYPHDAYAWWRERRPQDDFPHGAFGENLTVDDLPEDEILVGDVYEVGGAALRAVEPRRPCRTLAFKFQDPKIVKQFMESRRSGVYFAVEKEGPIRAGQTLALVSREKGAVSIRDLFLRRG